MQNNQKDIPDLMKALLRDEEKIAAIEKLGRLFYSSLDLQDILKKVLYNLPEVFAAERATLFLLDKEKNVLYSQSAVGMDDKSIVLPLGEGIVGWCVQKKQLVNVSDVYKDVRFNPSIDKKTGFKTKSILAIPLLSRSGSVLGVVELLNKKDGGGFTTEDEDLLRSICVHFSLALENIELYERLKESRKQLEDKVKLLNLLYAVERSANRSTDLMEFFEKAITTILEVTDSDAGSLVLVDKESKDLDFLIALGPRAMAVKRMKIKRGQGIIGWVVDNKKSVISNNVEKDPRHDKEIANKIGYRVKTTLCVPIMDGDSVYGAIELLNKKDGYNQDDLKALETLAANLSDLIESLVSDITIPSKKISYIVNRVKDLIDIATNKEAAKSFGNELLYYLGAIDRAESNVKFLIEQLKTRVVLLLGNKKIELKFIVKAKTETTLMGEPYRYINALFEMVKIATNNMKEGDKLHIIWKDNKTGLLIELLDPLHTLPKDIRIDKVNASIFDNDPSTKERFKLILKDISNDGGYISFFSKKGRGTAFEIFLPAKV